MFLELEFVFFISHIFRASVYVLDTHAFRTWVYVLDTHAFRTWVYVPDIPCL
jgi:hypothetical protein